MVIKNEKRCFLLTAQNCGHCHNYRGDGIINSNQAYMHPEFLKKVVAPYKDVNMTMFNIHYYNMQNPSNAGIKDISKTYMVGDVLFQERFYPSDTRNQTYAEVRSFDMRTNQIKLVIEKYEINKKQKSVEWLAFIKDKISPKLENYTYVFPSFLLVDKKNWNNSFDGKTELVGYLNIGWTVETENGEVMLEKSNESLQQRNENIFQMIDNYIVKDNPIKPHKTLKKENNEENKDAKKQEKDAKIKPISEDKKQKDNKTTSANISKIIQVSYDD